MVELCFYCLLYFNPGLLFWVYPLSAFSFEGLPVSQGNKFQFLVNIVFKGHFIFLNLYLKKLFFFFLTFIRVREKEHERMQEEQEQSWERGKTKGKGKSRLPELEECLFPRVLGSDLSGGQTFNWLSHTGFPFWTSKTHLKHITYFKQLYVDLLRVYRFLYSCN